MKRPRKSNTRKTMKRVSRKKGQNEEKGNMDRSLLSMFFYNVSLSMRSMNESKIFAGLMIVSMNVATKLVPIKISKTMEMYLRHTFSRNLLVFIICWVGTRDILISLMITSFFILFFDYLLNEEHPMCILPESFIDYHTALQDQLPLQQVVPATVPDTQEIKSQ